LSGLFKKSRGSGGKSNIETLEKKRNVKELMKILVNNSEPSLSRETAARALGAIEDPVAVSSLIIALQDTDRSVREASAGALGAIKDPAAVQALVVALKDTEAIVRFAAARALIEIKDPIASPALVDALKDESKEVREIAARALDKYKDPATVPAFVVALKDKSSDVRKTAVRALGEIKDRSAVSALVAAMKDEDRDIRKAVVNALGEIKDPAAVPALVAAFKDEVYDIRNASSYALVAIGQPAIPALVIALKDDDTQVRECALVTLETLGWRPGNIDEKTAFHKAYTKKLRREVIERDSRIKESEMEQRSAEFNAITKEVKNESFISGLLYITGFLREMCSFWEEHGIEHNVNLYEKLEYAMKIHSSQDLDDAFRRYQGDKEVFRAYLAVFQRMIETYGEIEEFISRYKARSPEIDQLNKAFEELIALHGKIEKIHPSSRSRKKIDEMTKSISPKEEFQNKVRILRDQINMILDKDSMMTEIVK